MTALREGTPRLRLECFDELERGADGSGRLNIPANKARAFWAGRGRGLARMLSAFGTVGLAPGADPDVAAAALHEILFAEDFVVAALDLLAPVLRAGDLLVPPASSTLPWAPHPPAWGADDGSALYQLLVFRVAWLEAMVAFVEVDAPPDYLDERGGLHCQARYGTRIWADAHIPMVVAAEDRGAWSDDDWLLVQRDDLASRYTPGQVEGGWYSGGRTDPASGRPIDPSRVLYYHFAPRWALGIHAGRLPNMTSTLRDGDLFGTQSREERELWDPFDKIVTKIVAYRRCKSRGTSDEFQEVTEEVPVIGKFIGSIVLLAVLGSYASARGHPSWATRKRIISDPLILTDFLGCPGPSADVADIQRWVAAVEPPDPKKVAKAKAAAEAAAAAAAAEGRPMPVPKNKDGQPKTGQQFSNQITMRVCFHAIVAEQIESMWGLSAAMRRCSYWPNVSTIYSSAMDDIRWRVEMNVAAGNTNIFAGLRQLMAKVHGDAIKWFWVDTPLTWPQFILREMMVADKNAQKATLGPVFVAHMNALRAGVSLRDMILSSGRMGALRPECFPSYLDAEYPPAMKRLFAKFGPDLKPDLEYLLYVFQDNRCVDGNTIEDVKRLRQLYAIRKKPNIVTFLEELRENDRLTYEALRAWYEAEAEADDLRLYPAPARQTINAAWAEVYNHYAGVRVPRDSLPPGSLSSLVYCKNCHKPHSRIARPRVKATATLPLGAADVMATLDVFGRVRKTCRYSTKSVKAVDEAALTPAMPSAEEHTKPIESGAVSKAVTALFNNARRRMCANTEITVVNIAGQIAEYRGMLIMHCPNCSKLMEVNLLQTRHDTICCLECTIGLAEIRIECFNHASDGAFFTEKTPDTKGWLRLMVHDDRPAKAAAAASVAAAMADLDGELPPLASFGSLGKEKTGARAGQHVVVALCPRCATPEIRAGAAEHRYISWSMLANPQGWMAPGAIAAAARRARAAARVAPPTDTVD